jgi:hypothetical protein
MVSQNPLTEAEIEPEIDKAIEFVSVKECEPITPTGPQRLKMKELLRQHGRKNFRTAVHAFVKDHPWNAQTYPQNRWSGFVNGYAGYAAMKTVKENAVSHNERERQMVEDSTLWHTARLPIGSMGKEWGQYIPLDAVFLTEDDREYLKKVTAAKCIADLPPNAKQRSIDLMERHREWKKAEAEKRELELAAGGSF